jgi:NAD(P)-dependent dehydrogenase (short-subunit alcohol dehydrogenase family)
MKIVITGASDGIGAAAARNLVQHGATVVLVGRSPEKTQKIARELKMPSYVADFSDFKTVHQLARRIRVEHGDLNVLINNAGAVFESRNVSPDWHEMTFQVNHLAPFLLTKLLLNVLQDNSASVLNTSSVDHRTYGNLDINDLENARSYSPWKAYSNAKLANILFTRELHNRYHDRGLSAVAFHPGRVTSEPSGFFRFTSRKRLAAISPTDGGRSITWLATGQPGRDWTSGGYYEGFTMGKINPQADDVRLARELWERSWSMVTEPIV